MDIAARLSVDVNLTSDLFEHLSDSSSESEDSHSDGGSSSGSGSEGQPNSPTQRSDDSGHNSESDSHSDGGSSSGSGSEEQSDSPTQRSDDSGHNSESDSHSETSDDWSIESPDVEPDKFDRRLLRLVGKAFRKFNKDLEALIKALPLQELRSENRSELESCMVSFYSNLRDQTSSCLYTFYGPKSYELNRVFQHIHNYAERKSQRFLNKVWTKCIAKRDLPSIRGPPPLPPAPQIARVAQPPRRLQEQELIGPASEPKSSEQSRKKIDTGDAKRVWNHITISRDQTRASNFAKELLNILRISSRYQASENSNTNDYPHEPESKSSNLGSVWRSSTPGPFLPSQAKVEREEVVLTRPDHYFGGALVSGPLGSNRDFNESSLSPRGFAAKMNDQPQTNTSGEPSTPELSDGVEASMPRSVPRPKATVDGSLDQLMGRLASLETENRDLKEAKQSLARIETVYFIQAERRAPVPYFAFLDEPSWAVGPGGEIALKSRFGVHDINGFLRQKNDIAFVINKYYDQGYQEQEVRAAIRDKRPLPRAECSREGVRLQSPEMVQAAEEFVIQQPDFAQRLPGIDNLNGIGAPYLFWYYYRSKKPLEGLSSTSLAAMKLLTSWIEENYGKLYDLVDNQLKRGVISAKTIEFLVRPGDVLVWKVKRDLMAAVAEYWPLVRKVPQARKRLELNPRRDDWGTKNKSDGSNPLWKSNVKCWEYGFDGLFYRRARELEISFEAEDQEEEVPITMLNAYPLQYAPVEWKLTLEARGKMSWSCRHQRIASCEDDRGFYGNNERFMVDFHTYEQLHSDSNNFKKSYPTIDDPNVRRMDSDIMKSEDPPPAPDLYVFPNSIPAYNLRSKKWVDLEVDKMRDVTWNKKSFEHLVVDIETKDLIQALITNQIARGEGTDTIDGKGNGLIILLHGGPGTGKTFTAESVAEMAEKPLFRVTCGDIGTKPEEVEKYLESVLHLGKNWGCVVLLDEADVFLEQRTLTDLERNALVSVFLRVLEYYEGILILTSNRVGTFDEAFKSRIQLSLHYENLTEGQRRKIWKNFLSRLKDLERQGFTGAMNGERLLPDKDPHSMGIDFDDVECYLSDLARFEMNGRQIRNAITTARQLAKFKGELMAYHHLQHVIKVSSKFDSYLTRVRDGFSDDQIARGERVR